MYLNSQLHTITNNTLIQYVVSTNVYGLLCHKQTCPQVVCVPDVNTTGCLTVWCETSPQSDWGSQLVSETCVTLTLPALVVGQSQSSGALAQFPSRFHSSQTVNIRSCSALCMEQACEWQTRRACKQKLDSPEASKTTALQVCPKTVSYFCMLTWTSTEEVTQILPQVKSIRG